MLKRDTAAALAEAEKGLADTELAIGTARQQRSNMLVDGTADQVAEFDTKIIGLHRLRNVYAERLEGLQSRLAKEQAAEREKRRQAAIVAIEKLLPAWPAAVEKYIRWVKSGVSAKAGLAEARAQIAAAWPIEDIQPPFAAHFDVDRLVNAANTPGGDLDDLLLVQRERMVEIADGLKQPPAKDQAA